MSRKFKDRVLTTLSLLKKRNNKRKPDNIVIYDKDDKISAFLVPICKETITNNVEIELLAKWRKENSFAFPTQFPVSLRGTKEWVKNSLVGDKTRILFFIKTNTKDKILIGHMGLHSFNFRDNTCEIDNVVRGVKDYFPGIMTLSLIALLNWTKKKLNPKHIYLKVFSDNNKAIRLYKRCGFKEINKIPLKKTEKNNAVIWIETKTKNNCNKYNLLMKYSD